MSIPRLHIAMFLLVAAWPLRWASGDPSAPVSGRIVNVTGSCGERVALSVQLLGAEVSPRVDVPADGEVAMSLPPGVYGVTAMAPGGVLVEESRVLVTRAGFRVPAGCPTRAPAPEAFVPPAEGERVPVQLFNSSMDCGLPQTVEFVADGVWLGRLEPGARVAATAPRGATLIEAYVQGRRAFSATRPAIEAGAVLTCGCTVADATGPAAGIPVAFENTTDTCTDPAQHRHLTLWVDGMPVVGVGPGQRAGVRVTPGPHAFQVFVGMTQERVVRGAKDVQAPFRIHFGCGR